MLSVSGRTARIIDPKAKAMESLADNGRNPPWLRFIEKAATISMVATPPPCLCYTKSPKAAMLVDNQ